jgi:hypothetical protein
MSWKYIACLENAFDYNDIWIKRGLKLLSNFHAWFNFGYSNLRFKNNDLILDFNFLILTRLK